MRISQNNSGLFSPWVMACRACLLAVYMCIDATGVTVLLCTALTLMIYPILILWKEQREWCEISSISKINNAATFDLDFLGSAALCWQPEKWRQFSWDYIRREHNQKSRGSARFVRQFGNVLLLLRTLLSVYLCSWSLRRVNLQLRTWGWWSLASRCTSQWRWCPWRFPSRPSSLPVRTLRCSYLKQWNDHQRGYELPTMGDFRLGFKNYAGHMKLLNVAKCKLHWFCVGLNTGLGRLTLQRAERRPTGNHIADGTPPPPRTRQRVLDSDKRLYFKCV